MNRRSFFASLAAGVAAISVLPSATTYARRWVVPKRSLIAVPNPDWFNAPYEMVFAVSGVQRVTVGSPSLFPAGALRFKKDEETGLLTLVPPFTTLVQ